MFATYKFNGGEIDSLNLKYLLLTEGIHAAEEELSPRYKATRRLNLDDPYANDIFTLSDGRVVLLYQNPASRFSLRAADPGPAYVARDGTLVTEVEFLPHLDFYQQRTSQGRRFAEFAVIGGVNDLTFPFLWPCDVAHSQGGPCTFCHCGQASGNRAREGKPRAMFPTPQEVAEVVDYVFNVEKFGYTLQITGGTRRDFDVEAGYAKKLLATIDEVIGLRNIPGEVIIYISPPKDPPAIDQLFEAGATRVSLDLEAWDREAFQRVCPGKTPFFDREVALRAQDYIVETYGPWKAYSSFVVGAEPLTTLMAGADYIASRGVVPIMPVVNHQNPMLAGMDARPRLDYYRATYEGYMEIFAKYDVPQPNKGRCGCCVCGE